jgi:hypothetical protein
MKVVNYPWNLVPAAVQSSSFTSSAHDSIAYYGMSVQVNITGASGLSGTMKLQASNDNVNWIDLTQCCGSTSVDIAFSGNTSEMWVYTTIIPYQWIRLNVTISAGSATFKAIVAGVRI